MQPLCLRFDIVDTAARQCISLYDRGTGSICKDDNISIS